MLRLGLIVSLALAGGAAGVDRNSAFIGYSETSGGGGGMRGGSGDGGGGDLRGGSGGGGGSAGCKLDDSHENCESWSRNGECEKNPGYMREQCALSCGAPCPPPARVPGPLSGGLVVFHTSEVGLARCAKTPKNDPSGSRCLLL
jgi:hypothetical protein